MAGMQLLGAGAFLDGLDEMTEMFTADSDGYRMATNIEYAPYQEFGTSSQPGTAHSRPGGDAAAAEMAQLATQAADLDEFLRLTALQWQRETASRAPVESGTLQGSYQVDPL